MTKNLEAVAHEYLFEKDKTKERQSNIELLRIICMIMIIMSHYAMYNGFETTNDINVNNLIIQIFRITQTRCKCICNNYRIFYDQ